MTTTRLETLNDLLEAQIEEYKYLARHLTTKKYETVLDIDKPVTHKKAEKTKTLNFKSDQQAKSKMNRVESEKFQNIPIDVNKMDLEPSKKMNGSACTEGNPQSFIKPFRYTHSTIYELKLTLTTKQQEIHSTITSIITLINTSTQDSASISQFYLIHSNYKKFMKKLKNHRLTHLNTILQTASQRQHKIKNLDEELSEIQQLNQLITDTIDLQDNHINNLELAMLKSKEQSYNTNLQLDQRRKKIKKWRIWKIVTVVAMLLVIIKLINMAFF